MIKSNKEVTLKTRETYFLYRKPQNLKIAKSVFQDIFSEKVIEKFLGESHSAKKTKSGQLSQKL